MKKRMRITRGGQLSIPAAIRHRWGTSAVALEDQGDRLVIEPVPEDPIAAADGAFTEEFGMVDSLRLRRAARQAQQVAEARRAR